MKKRAGLTFVELLAASTILGMMLIGTMSLYLACLKQFSKTSTGIDLASQNALGTRKVLDTLRSCMTATISADGKTLTYQMPALSSTADSVTGEKEYTYPLTASNAVSQTFVVSNGKLVDSASGKTLVQNIYATDPDPSSSQYGQTVAPFTFTTIGSRKGVCVNLITRKVVNGVETYVRMKNTVILRNG
ncbi:MAG: hypothetical protein JSS65_02100 [Armatimonadetes bacterium]|nr:hypothetical protein [Armatimonadota bacterium]